MALVLSQGQMLRQRHSLATRARVTQCAAEGIPMKMDAVAAGRWCDPL